MPQVQMECGSGGGADEVDQIEPQPAASGERVDRSSEQNGVSGESAGAVRIREVECFEGDIAPVAVSNQLPLPAVLPQKIEFVDQLLRRCSAVEPRIASAPGEPGGTPVRPAAQRFTTLPQMGPAPRR